MAHIFISYSRKDTEYRERLERSLRKRGFDVWSDEGMKSGEAFVARIVEQIAESAAVVVLMSPNSEKSKWVGREILIAERENKPIFPLLLAGRALPNLIEVHFEDVSAGRLPSKAFYQRLSEVAPPTKPSDSASRSKKPSSRQTSARQEQGDKQPQPTATTAEESTKTLEQLDISGSITFGSADKMALPTETENADKKPARRTARKNPNRHLKENRRATLENVIMEVLTSKRPWRITSSTVDIVLETKDDEIGAVTKAPDKQKLDVIKDNLAQYGWLISTQSKVNWGVVYGAAGVVTISSMLLTTVFPPAALLPLVTPFFMKKDLYLQRTWKLSAPTDEIIHDLIGLLDLLTDGSSIEIKPSE